MNRRWRAGLLVGLVLAGFRAASAEERPAAPAGNAASQKLAATLEAAGYTAVPLRRGARTGYWYVEMLANGKPMVMLIDTGAEVSCLTPEAVRRCGYNVPDKGIARQVTDGGPIFTTFRHVWPRIGPADAHARVSRATVDAISGFTALTADDAIPRCDGLLGNLFLKSHAAVLDYPGRRLYLLDPYKQERALFGEWVCVACDNGTDVRRGTAVSAVRLSIRPDGVTYGSKVKHRYQLMLDPSTDKKRMDWVRPDEGALPIIYRIDGDRLILAGPFLESAADYPTDFKSKADGTCVVLEFVPTRDEVAPPPRPARGAVPPMIPPAK